MVRDLFSDAEECGDGSEALAAYHQHRPDWVVMDIAMSRMDGITATQEILKAFPAARVVIVSKHDDEQVRETVSSGSVRIRFEIDPLAIRE